MLRSCYRTRMQFGPGVVKEVIWQFCQGGAKTLPYRTRFCSSIWDSYRDEILTDGLGELDRPTNKTWRDGLMVPKIPGTRLPCGSQADWENGPADPSLQLPMANGFPVCCAGTVPADLQTDGVAVVTYTPGGITTDCCPATPIPVNLFVRFRECFDPGCGVFFDSPVGQFVHQGGGIWTGSPLLGAVAQPLHWGCLAGGGPGSWFLTHDLGSILFGLVSHPNCVLPGQWVYAWTTAGFPPRNGFFYVRDTPFP